MSLELILTLAGWLASNAIAGVIAWKRAKTQANRDNEALRIAAETTWGAIETAPDEISRPAKEWIERFGTRLGVETTTVGPVIQQALDDLADNGKLDNWESIADSLIRRRVPSPAPTDLCVDELTELRALLAEVKRRGTLPEVLSLYPGQVSNRIVETAAPLACGSVPPTDIEVAASILRQPPAILSQTEANALRATVDALRGRLAGSIAPMTPDEHAAWAEKIAQVATGQPTTSVR